MLEKFVPVFVYAAQQQVKIFKLSVYKVLQFMSVVSVIIRYQVDHIL